MISTLNFARRALRGGVALQALALVGASVAIGGVAAPAAAQDYSQVNATGRIQGTNGQPIAGATVTVTSNDQGFSRTATTGSDGTFRISSLPQGSYTFSVSASGYDSFTDNSVTLTQAGAANQFTLSPTGAADAGDIIVRAGRVQVVDFDRNTTGAVINVGELATRVPVARDITSVALLSPGASAGDNRFGSFPSLNGASVSENAYYVNGLNTTQFRNGLGAVAVPFEFYQTVEVKNNGISAEFGRFTGGVVNATTKSGSNTFHGGVGFIWQPNELTSKGKNTLASDEDARYTEQKDFVAQLSGPIIKDHLFFYGIYDSRERKSNIGATSAASSASTCANNTACAPFADLAQFGQQRVGTQYIRDSNTSPFYGGKIDAVIVDGQRIEGTYWNTSGSTYRNVYGYNAVTNTPGAFQSTTLFRSGGENYVFRYTGSFTNWLTLSAAYGVNKNKDTTESTTPNIPSVQDARFGGSITLGNTAANNSVNLDKRTFYRADADLNFSLFGSHHIRFGYDREDLDESSFTSANGGAQYSLNRSSCAGVGCVDPVSGLTNGTDYVIARTFITGGQFTSRDQAYYIQDSWSLFDNRLQLNLGIRNDKFVNTNADGVAFFTAKNQWGPRLGFSADPLGDGRTKVFGSFSRYFLPVAINTNVRLAGSELDYDAYYRFAGLGANNVPIISGANAITNLPNGEACVGGNPAGLACVVRNDGTVPDTSSVVASNLKPQSTDEYVLGFEQRFGSRIRASAYFTYVHLNDSLEDASLDQAIVPYCVSQGKTAAACRSIWNGVHQYALINPGRDVAITLSDPLPGENTLRTVTLGANALNYPKATRNYRAMTFTFDREFDGKWSLSANYVYSKLVGNIEGGVRSDNAQTDSGLTTAFDLPALVNGTYGYLPNDRRHNFKIYGSYQVTPGLVVGLQAIVQSPRKFGCYGRAPASADYDATSPSGLAGRFYGAGAAYCNVVNGQVVRDPTFAVINDSLTRAGGPRPSTLTLVPRGSQLKADWLSQINLDGQLKVPSDSFDAYLRFSVFNVFNSQPVLRVSETGTTSAGTPAPAYSLPTQYAQPRYARIQLGVNF
ncbi:TonB-dependent receptor [uncultured Sphingomonas sp.]|uniref:TonB-dependent receptor n=2 Tax=Pseudomonadota TaxID=1224 RepID=UPI00259394C9|nr:TonB-dependent receptor [uncultured Sphingomonas sp.]